MSLKTATSLAITGISLNLLIALLRTVLFQFEVLSYTDHELFFQVMNYVQILVLNVPILIFFIVLRSNQK
jgi:hypothetical protein